MEPKTWWEGESLDAETTQRILAEAVQYGYGISNWHLYAFEPDDWPEFEFPTEDRLMVLKLALEREGREPMAVVLLDEQQALQSMLLMLLQVLASMDPLGEGGRS